MASSLIDALELLGEFVAGVRAPQPGTDLEGLLHRSLFDSLGVLVAGHQTAELRALVRAWDASPGPVRVLGGGRGVSLEAGAYLNGVANVCLELDEGNKYARGHPAAHVLPATLALAQRIGASGPTFAAAYLAGYEVAARFGRATMLNPDVHPHGNWGLAGAAAACARLLGLSPRAVAEAIDAACAMMQVTPWAMAFEGDLVRNTWTGACAVSGIAASKMARAGLARLTGTARWSLGSVLGTFDPSELVVDLGRRFDLSNAYYKRHACCSYTHPPADAALDLVAREHLAPAAIRSVHVETHPIAAALNGCQAGTRLGAMFSVPYVVAAALVHGRLDPPAFDSDARGNADIRRLMNCTTVHATEEFARRLPHERGARVSLVLQDGSVMTEEVPNPVGDVAYRPFVLTDVRAKLDTLLPDTCPVDRFEELVRALVVAPNVNSVLDQMP